MIDKLAWQVYDKVPQNIMLDLFIIHLIRNYIEDNRVEVDERELAPIVKENYFNGGELNDSLIERSLEEIYERYN